MRLRRKGSYIIFSIRRKCCRQADADSCDDGIWQCLDMRFLQQARYLG